MTGPEAEAAVKSPTYTQVDIERVARAICRAECKSQDPDGLWPVEAIIGHAKQAPRWMFHMEAAEAAIRSWLQLPAQKEGEAEST